ncbi:hypothetical protein AYI69_g1704 [Smittium culicis]|uniref:Uncharacterized protein n=1 Tax=Smittium culicis TaxID=133412 RepID=A0A1R1YPJ6_9FUNG|nr:hypothetical protein AYI69_g1704 [Smittium culicis]
MYQNTKLYTSSTKGQISESIYSSYDTDEELDYMNDEQEYNYNRSSIEDGNQMACHSKKIRTSRIIGDCYSADLMKNNTNNEIRSNHSGIQPIIDVVKFEKSNKSDLAIHDSICVKQNNDHINSFESRLSFDENHQSSSKISENGINILKTQIIQSKNISNANNSKLDHYRSKEARNSTIIPNENTFKSKFDRLKSDPSTKNSNSLWYL